MWMKGRKGYVYGGEIGSEGGKVWGKFGEVMEVWEKYGGVKVGRNGERGGKGEDGGGLGGVGMGVWGREEMLLEEEKIVGMGEMIVGKEVEGGKKGVEKVLG